MEAQHANPLGELGVVHRDEAAVPEAEEVLRGIEAEGRRDARSGDLGRAERLRGVLDQRQPELGELGERRGPPEQMHRHDRLRAARDSFRDPLGVEVERVRIDVREDRRRADPRDRLGGGVERERRADHLVARADLERVQDEDDRVRAVPDADRLAHAEIARRLLLERADVRPEDELAALENVVDRLLDLR